jgi:hypothetical protein
MALAPFNDMLTQSASSLLAGFRPRDFQRYLSAQRVALAFDSALPSEARATLELATDLLARFYPALDIVPLEASPEQHAVATKLLATAQLINPRIEGGREFAPGTTACLVVGKTHPTWDATVPTVYIGSDGWIANVSTERPIGSGNSANPFGAGAAACIGVSNIFRSVFASQLPASGLDRRFTLSLLDYRLGSTSPTNTQLPQNIDLGEPHLVGVGAIGHGAIWALRRTQGLSGKVHLVDPDYYDETNPQRYVETTYPGVNVTKVANAASLLNSRGMLTGIPHELSWDSYLATREDWRVNLLLLALDSAEDRVFAQASLPRYLINSWTQPDNVGLSRHDFLNSACVACLYLPSGERPDLDDLVATALKFEGDQALREVRRYLDTRLPLDHAILERIAQQVGLPTGSLEAFHGALLIDLYHRGACGGLILNLGGSVGEGKMSQAEVPMAFQSALAGIMLAAEAVIHASGLRQQELPVRTEINLLRPISGTLSSPEKKNPKQRCICQDRDFIDVYLKKYQLGEEAIRPAILTGPSQVA